MELNEFDLMNLFTLSCDELPPPTTLAAADRNIFSFRLFRSLPRAKLDIFCTPFDTKLVILLAPPWRPPAPAPLVLPSSKPTLGGGAVDANEMDASLAKSSAPPAAPSAVCPLQQLSVVVVVFAALPITLPASPPALPPLLLFRENESVARDVTDAADVAEDCGESGGGPSLGFATAALFPAFLTVSGLLLLFVADIVPEIPLDERLFRFFNKKSVINEVA